MASREGKTEAPTQKRKQEARKKGTRPKSADLAGWVTVLACTYAVPSTIRSVRTVVVRSLADLSGFADHADAADVVPVLASALHGALFALLPLLLVCMAVGTVTHIAQTGFGVSLHQLKPDVKRLNPIQGLKRLFSARSVWETAKQLVKALLVGWLARPHVMSLAERLGRHGQVALGEGVAAVAADLVGMVRAIAWTIVIVAVVDYGYQRRNHMLDLRMTKQEVRDEFRNSEGDQKVKQQIRSIQRALAMNRMMADVPGASVVVTNPTHIAVALRYDPAKRAAPTIVAAGAGAVAARIRERAQAAGVPIVESKPLARALYRTCEIGDEIPFALYDAVAKVLAFVRRLRGTVLSAGALTLPSTYRVDVAALEALPARRRMRRLE
jgi:flagellar biosynthetic protein FlhB